ncbi:MAG: hypothetical protein ABR886_10880 [Dehalococcoidales bacterium]|jgi:hypothetical protein
MMFLNSDMAQTLSSQESKYQTIINQPHRGLTGIALKINKILATILFFPIFPIQLITTFVLGILTTITFGIFAWLTTGIWLLFLGPLLGTSWLWTRLPFLRPILILPGVLWARASGICATIFPSMGDWSARKIKLDICDIWPLSWNLLKTNIS